MKCVLAKFQIVDYSKAHCYFVQNIKSDVN